jgi:hypothetical protein
MMKKTNLKDTIPKRKTPQKSFKSKCGITFSCLSAIPFLVFGFVYFDAAKVGGFSTGLLIALVIFLVLSGLMYLKRTVDQIDELSQKMKNVEGNKSKWLQFKGETKELSIISETFNRMLYKLGRATKDLSAMSIQSEILSEMSDMVSKKVGIQEITKTTLLGAVKAVNAKAGYIAVRNVKKPILHVAATFGIRKEIPRTVNLSGDRTLAGIVCESKSPILIPDIEEEPRLKSLNKPDMGMQSLLYLSIFANRSSVGMLALGREGTQPFFQEKDIQFLKTLLRIVAFGIQNSGR